jgi:hypothetical protein
MSDQLQEFISAAAARDQLNRSAWVREVLAAAATSPLTLPEILAALQSQPPSRLNGHHRWKSPNPRLGAAVLARSCLHRADLIDRYPTFDRCRACGQEWPR